MSTRKGILLDFIRNSMTLVLLVREVLVGLVALMVLNGVLFSLAEGRDVGSSIYFAFITGLTIGYGDITPVTTLGRIVAVFTGICGTVFVGLVVAINTRSLKATYEEAKPQE